MQNNKSSKPKTTNRSDQKKAAKKVLANTTKIPKLPSAASNPNKSVAKKLVSDVSRIEQRRQEDIVKILLSISAPRAYPPVRLGAQMGSYETATANPMAVQTASFITPASSLLKETSTAFLFRDPFRYFVTSIDDTAAGSWEYRTTFGGAIGLNTNPVPLIFNRWGWYGGDKVHGNFLYPGRTSDSVRSFMPLSQGNVIEFLNQNASLQTQFRTYYYDIAGNISNSAVTTVNPGASATIATGTESTVVYVGFDVYLSGTGLLLGNFSLKRGSGTTVWAHRALPFLDTNVVSADAIKLYGGSLMYTNEASPLNRQGKLAAAQIPQGRDWRDFVDYDSIASVKGSYRDQVLNGYYGFLKPTQPSDIDFIENHEIENNTLAAAWYPINPTSDFLAFTIKVVDSNGRDGYYTYDAALEYRTNDQWRDVRLPDISASTVFEAMSLVAQLPQHHENDFHIGDIFSWIKDRVSDVWTGVKQAFPYVLSGLETAGKVAAVLTPFMM